MLARYLAFLFIVAGLMGCARNSVSWAREPTKVDATCVVDIDDGPRSVEVTEETRRACVVIADIIEPELPTLSVESLHAGPPSEHAFRADDHVYCRLVPRPEQGGSLKFRCMRADSANRLYDDRGTLVATLAPHGATSNILPQNGKAQVLLLDLGNFEGDASRSLGAERSVALQLAI
jgi:hypothetical protein